MSNMHSRSIPECSRLKNRTSTDGQCKRKRLKTRKERSRIRGGGKEASQTESHHHHCRHPSSKKSVHVHTFCQRRCHCLSKRDAPLLNAVPAAQEPSIITDSRLIGHHGLFSHEVKSIDIERLVTEQRKMGKCGQQIPNRNNAISRPPSTCHIPSASFSNSDEVVQLEEKPGQTEAHADCEEREKKSLQPNSQGSDLTPGQRPQQQHELLSGSYKSNLLSRRRSLDVVMKSREAAPVTPENCREPQLTPACDGECVQPLIKKMKPQLFSPLERASKNQELTAHQTHGLSPGLPQVFSSSTGGAKENLHIQDRQKDLNFVSKSVSAIAARLSCSLQFPRQKKRTLVAEYREVLLRALQEQHGPQLHGNLLKVQQYLNFGTDCARAVQRQNQKPGLACEDGLWSTEALTAAFQADAAPRSCFGTQKPTPLTMIGSKPFNWKSTPQPDRSLGETAGWSTRSAETPVRLLEDIFKSTAVSLGERLFAPTTSSYRRAKDTPPQLCENFNTFNKAKGEKSFVIDSFEDSFINQTRAVRERSSGLQCSDSNMQPFFPYRAHQPDRYPAEPKLFPREQSSFESARCPFAPDSFVQIDRRHQCIHQRFKYFNHPPTCCSIRSQHTDMRNYPPSHMLEKSPAPTLSSLLSPEHWTFPPMRLY